MADHVLGDGDLVVDLAVVYKELKPDEAGQDGGGARLRPDRLARSGDVEPATLATARSGSGGGMWAAYGTILGPVALRVSVAVRERGKPGRRRGVGSSYLSRRTARGARALRAWWWW
jgi:hypothetical protein